MFCSLSRGLRTATCTLALLPALATAATTIDFEQYTGVDYMPGTPVPTANRLADQLLASHGLRFSSAGGFVALVDLGLNHAFSGRIGVTGTGPDGRVNYGTEVRVSFFDLASGAAGVTDQVSWVTDRLGDSRNVTLTAFDIDGRQIAQQTWKDTGYTVLTLAVAGMHSVSFLGAGYAALDNLGFNTITLPATPVPEPASAGLLAAGLLAMSWGMRRRLHRGRG